MTTITAEEAMAKAESLVSQHANMLSDSAHDRGIPTDRAIAEISALVVATQLARIAAALENIDQNGIFTYEQNDG